MGFKGAKPFILLAFFTALLFMPFEAMAAKKRLSEDSVAEFITKTAAIMSGHVGDMSDRQIVNYLDRHLEKDARFKSILQYNTPGFPSQETAMSFGKEAFIDNIKDGQKKVNDFESKIEILSISLSKDRKKAIVKTRSMEEAMLPIPMGNGETQTVPVEGDALCDQIITINKRGVLQMFSASCMTTINFLPYGAL